MRNKRVDKFDQSSKMSFVDLLKQMRIVTGPPEYLKPLNVGLLLFSDKPENFFRGAKIEIVEYKDDVGDNFTEKIFTGPLHYQLRNALNYIKNSIIKEYVHKVDNQAEAIRFYNYPYTAIEEALVNAVYHRDYEHRSTIEVNIRPECIEILSFPGPLPPINNSDLKKKKVIARDYRNRRLGDFLKELNLTEGRCTGIPKIYKALKDNGSHKPLFKTDRNRTYFLTTLLIHPEYKKQAKKLKDKQPLEEGSQKKSPEKFPENCKNIIKLIIKNKKITIREMAEKINVSDRTIKNNIKKLKNQGVLKRVGPDKGGYWKIIR